MTTQAQQRFQFAVEFFRKVQDLPNITLYEIGQFFDIALVMSGVRNACLHHLDSHICDIIQYYVNNLNQQIIGDNTDNSLVLIMDRNEHIRNDNVDNLIEMVLLTKQLNDTYNESKTTPADIDCFTLGKILNYQQPLESIKSGSSPPLLKKFFLKLYLYNDSDDCIEFYTECCEKQPHFVKFIQFMHQCEPLAKMLGYKLSYEIEFC